MPLIFPENCNQGDIDTPDFVNVDLAFIENLHDTILRAESAPAKKNNMNCRHCLLNYFNYNSCIHKQFKGRPGHRVGELTLWRKMSTKDIMKLIERRHCFRFKDKPVFCYTGQDFDIRKLF